MTTEPGASHRAPPCAVGFAAGRLSIDVRLVVHEPASGRGLHVFDRHLVELVENRVDPLRIVVEQGKGRQQVGAAEARHEAAFHVLEERRSQRGLGLRELRLGDALGADLGEHALDGVEHLLRRSCRSGSRRAS